MSGLGRVGELCGVWRGVGGFASESFHDVGEDAGVGGGLDVCEFEWCVRDPVRGLVVGAGVVDADHGVAEACVGDGGEGFRACVERGEES